MVVGNTPETTNPVADQCEANGVPCLSIAGAVAAVVLPQRLGRPGGGLRVDLPLLLGPRGRHRGVPRHVVADRDQQGDRRAVAQRRRRPGLGRPRARVPAGLRGGRLHADRPGPLREPHRGLQRPDQRLQDRRRRDPHRRADPARLHDLLEAGQAAGLHAQGRLGRQGAAVPRLGGRAGRRRRRPVDRGVVEPEPPVLELAHRPDRPRSWPTPTRRPPASSGPSRIGFAHGMFEVAVDALNRSGRDRAGRHPRRHRGDRSRHHRRQGPVGGRRRPCPRTSPRRRWSAASGRRPRAASSPTTWSSCRTRTTRTSRPRAPCARSRAARAGPAGRGRHQRWEASSRSSTRANQFGSLVVIDDLSFELSEGEALGVVGPNGAGKTTMLNVWPATCRPRRRHGTTSRARRDRTRGEPAGAGSASAARRRSRGRSSG